MYIEGFSIVLDVWWRQKYCAYDLFQARSISLFVLLNNAVYSFVDLVGAASVDSNSWARAI